MACDRESAKRLLVTGAGGFLGRHVAHLATSGWKVYGVWHREPLAVPGVKSVREDLSDGPATRRMLDAVCPHAVIHCAALTDLDYCEVHPAEAQLVNVEATRTVARWCGENGARLVFVSSDMVFDGRRGLYRETDETNPINVYGKTKVEGERIVSTLCSNHLIARAALIYGRPRGGGSSFSTWIEQRLLAGEPVPLFADQYRTPILVLDLAEALVELCTVDYVGVLHLAGPERVDRHTFGSCLARTLGYDGALLLKRRITDAPTVAPRPQDVSLDTTLAQALLRTRLHGVEQGLRRMAAAEGEVATPDSQQEGR